MLFCSIYNEIFRPCFSIDGIRPDPSKIMAQPSNAKVLVIKQLLGITRYYRKFIRDYATVAYPIPWYGYGKKIALLTLKTMNF